ncbi:Na(+)/H(+) exchanger protein 7-like protein [Dinothrombium tinctorium]|uniref:Sodium/hydrogen exchanger n=1 Tax=Dinothrombium tinctorium TaxID=1965070 RepID=A0A3S3S8Y8_9ACAR|nr:Na(+)/H(+) exchanger protein 7-like protein [Dinothrombium tinctorium]
MNGTLHLNDTHAHHDIELIGWRWDIVGGYLVDGICLLIAASIKIGYHHIPYLSSYVPESCVLIILGILVGVTLYFTKADQSRYVPKFTSNLFFFCLLPPIILESAYSLYDRNFFSNLATILLLAVIGTLMNVALIGGSLYACSSLNFFHEKIAFVEILIFATLISAVDPVAVLAIFQEVNVNKALYFLVFGESLLNDAVVITVYNTVSVFAGPKDLTFVDIIKAIASFVIVSLGGLSVGAIMGAITSLLTKCTQGVRVVEPLLVIILAYIAYVAAELFHFSGIISIIGCGLVQAEYARHNVSRKTFTTVFNIVKTLSSIADVIIFIFLGVVLIRENHVWDTLFVLFTTIFCVVYRFIAVFFLTFCANFYRRRKVNTAEKVIMAYGGLRGAIAFSLCITLNSTITQIHMFTTTTLFVILFTVFVMGSTTKVIVRCLNVQSQNGQNKFYELNEKLMDDSMSGIECILGSKTISYWVNKLRIYNDIYLKTLLIKGYKSYAKVVRDAYEKIFRDKLLRKSDSNVDLLNQLSMENKFRNEEILPKILTSNKVYPNTNEIHSNKAHAEFAEPSSLIARVAQTEKWINMTMARLDNFESIATDVYNCKNTIRQVDELRKEVAIIKSSGDGLRREFVNEGRNLIRKWQSLENRTLFTASKLYVFESYLRSMRNTIQTLNATLIASALNTFDEIHTIEKNLTSKIDLMAKIKNDFNRKFFIIDSKLKILENNTRAIDEDIGEIKDTLPEIESNLTVKIKNALTHSGFKVENKLHSIKDEFASLKNRVQIIHSQSGIWKELANSKIQELTSNIESQIDDLIGIKATLIKSFAQRFTNISARFNSLKSNFSLMLKQFLRNNETLLAIIAEMKEMKLNMNDLIRNTNATASAWSNLSLSALVQRKLNENQDGEIEYLRIWLFTVSLVIICAFIFLVCLNCLLYTRIRRIYDDYLALSKLTTLNQIERL